MAKKNCSLVVRDLASGIALSLFTSETLLGHVGGQGSSCSCAPARRSLPSTRNPVAITGHWLKGSWCRKSIRCPWHHACFDLRSRRSNPRAGAHPSLPVWQVDHARLECASSFGESANGFEDHTVMRLLMSPDRILIESSRAARGIRCGGDVEAARLFRQYCDVLSNNSASPVDRPNLSKEYHAGSAPEGNPAAVRYRQACSTLKAVSICSSIQKSSRWIPRRVTLSSRAAELLLSTVYCSSAGYRAGEAADPGR